MKRLARILHASGLLVISICISDVVHALSTGDTLTIVPTDTTYPGQMPNSGSWYSMPFVDGDIYFSIEGLNGIKLGQVQLASGSHTGLPDGSENPGIDQPWDFLGDTGMHQTTIAPTVLSDDGNGNLTLDMSGWSWAWAGIEDIPLGGDPFNFPEDTGVATLSCSSTACTAGDTYILDYSAHTNLGMFPAGSGSVLYTLHLEGVISSIPIPATTWLFGSGLIGLIGVARRRK